jgi:hypothetical protein
MVINPKLIRPKKPDLEDRKFIDEKESICWIEGVAD